MQRYLATIVNVVAFTFLDLFIYSFFFYINPPLVFLLKLIISSESLTRQQ